MDTAYVNGHLVGASSWVENPRAYTSGRGLKPGRNLIAIRVFKLKSEARFPDPARRSNLAFAGGPAIPLAGEWKGAVSVDARPPHPLPLGYENYPVMPSVLYQGMIRPIAPLALTGVIWYQGEANAGRAHQYRTLLPAMIADWRAAFAQGDFPFLSPAPRLPAAQRPSPAATAGPSCARRRRTPRARADCGLAVTVDTGDADNIHPRSSSRSASAWRSPWTFYGRRSSPGPTYVRGSAKGARCGSFRPPRAG